jgi:hypothetical protein
MAAKFDEGEDDVARERCIDIPRPRPRSQPQGRLRQHRQRQAAQEGYRRRRQGAAIAAARREAAEAKVKAEVLLTKMKTMEATLSRVATMLPSLERLRRREDAAATKIQAAMKSYTERRKAEEMRTVLNQNFFESYFRTVTRTAVRGLFHRWSRHSNAKAAARVTAATKIRAAITAAYGRLLLRFLHTTYLGESVLVLQRGYCETPFYRWSLRDQLLYFPLERSRRLVRRWDEYRRGPRRFDSLQEVLEVRGGVL